MQPCGAGTKKKLSDGRQDEDTEEPSKATAQDDSESPAADDGENKAAEAEAQAESRAATGKRLPSPPPPLEFRTFCDDQGTMKELVRLVLDDPTRKSLGPEQQSVGVWLAQHGVLVETASVLPIQPRNVAADHVTVMVSSASRSSADSDELLPQTITVPRRHLLTLAQVAALRFALQSCMDSQRSVVAALQQQWASIDRLVAAAQSHPDLRGVIGTRLLFHDLHAQLLGRNSLQLAFAKAAPASVSASASTAGSAFASTAASASALTVASASACTVASAEAVASLVAGVEAVFAPTT